MIKKKKKTFEPFIVSDDGLYWYCRLYCKEDKLYYEYFTQHGFHKKKSEYKYKIPFSKFNFNLDDLKVNISNVINNI